MPKLLFIQPTQYAITKDGINKGLCKQKKIHLPGLVFPLLAALTPDNWEIEVKIEVIDDIDYNSNADLIGIGSMGYTIYRGIEIASEFKKRGKKVIMGGYMTSMAYNKVLEFADSVIIGDAEISYPVMLKEFEKTQKLQKIYNYPVDNLKNLPVPKYELLINKPISNMLPVQAGRGCPHNCSFCSIACLYKGKYLCRPIKEVMRDINRVKELGFKRFYLIDDNIVSNPGYLEDLCKEIEPLKMKWATQCDISLARKPDLLEKVVRAGAYMMSFGIEGISQKGLDKLNKSWLKVKDHEKLINILSNAGIMVSGEMMVGTDGDTEESIRNTYKFLNNVKLPLPRFYILTPTPGTELFDEFKKAKRLLTEDFNQYSGSKCVFKPKNITSDRLTDMYWWINKKIFSLRSIFIRTLLNPGFIKHPLNYLFAFFVNLHYRKYIKKGVPANIF